MLIRKIAFFLCLCLLVLLTASAALSQSPGDVYITPTSGGPGTVVTLVNTNKDFGFQCSAGGAGLGTVAPGGSVTYTVPSDAEGGSFIDFRCFITDVDVSDTVGVFAVSAPLPPAAADSDGDGLPDDADACPKEAASTQNGCPEQAPQPQPRTQAPQQPPPAAPTDVPPAQPPAATRVPLAQLPSSGACVVATLSGTAVNVRQGASTEEAVVGTLNPSRTYPVTARTADGEWYKIEAGWVAARVTRTGGDCGAVPVLSFEGITAETPTADFAALFAACPDVVPNIGGIFGSGSLTSWSQLADILAMPDPEARCAALRSLFQPQTLPPVVTATPDVRIAIEAPASYDMVRLLEQCPDLLEASSAFTFQAILQLIAISDGARRCDYARSLIQHATFLHGVGDPAPFRVASTACSGIFSPGIGREAATAYNAFINTLLDVDPDVASSRFSNRTLDDTFSQTWGWENHCDIFSLNRPRIAELGVARGLSNNELVTIAVSSCPRAYGMSAGRVRMTVIQMIQAGFVGADLLRDGDLCNLVNEVHQLGTLSSKQLFLFTVLVLSCDFDHYRQPIHDFDTDQDIDLSAANLVALADQLQSNIDGVLRGIDSAEICRDPLGFIRGYGYSQSQQRAAAQAEHSLSGYTPAKFQDCPPVFRTLERQGADISPAELLSLLRAPNPCELAWRWSLYRTPIPLVLGPARACMTGQALAVAAPAPAGPAGSTGQVVHDAPAPTRAGGDLDIRPDAPFGSIIYSDGRVISVRNDFRTKLWAVDKDVNAICDRTAVGPQFSDTVAPTPFLNLLDSSLTAIDVNAVLNSGLLILTPEAAPELGEPPTAEVTSATGAPPRPSEPTITVPAGERSTAAPAGTSPLLLPSPTLMVSAAAPASTPVSSADVPADGTVVAMLPPGAGTDELHNALDTVLDSAHASGAVGTLAVFQASHSDTSPADLYLLTMGGIKPLLVNTAASETHPVLDASGTRAAFIQTDSVGLMSVQVIDVTTYAQRALFYSTTELSVVDDAPAWAADGLSLLVTLRDGTGRDSIYALDVSDPDAVPPPTLMVPDAVNPALTDDGAYLAFARGTPSRRDIVVMEVKSGATLPITLQPDGSLCEHPSFDTIGLTLYFSCAQAGRMETYQYNLSGLTQLPVSINTVGDAVAGPTVDALTLSDGQTVYILDFSGPGEQTHEAASLPLITLENLRASNLRWRAVKPPEAFAAQ